MDIIHVCVGTDQRMRRAEAVLEHSIRKNTTVPVEMHWMRAGEDGWTGWRSQPKRPYQTTGGKWATLFTGFRLCVPEVLGHTGFGIYLDADMIVLGNIQELYDMRRPGRWVAARPNMEVGVIDCTAGSVPSMKEMAKTDVSLSMLSVQPMIYDIPPEWNSCDRVGKDTKLLHFTNMHTQPWKPWPERFSYKEKGDAEAETLFFEMEKEVKRGS